MFPFGKTRALESQIDEFLDLVVKGALGLRQAISCYLDCSAGDFAEQLTLVANLEHRADEIRRQTEASLYTQALIPESRGDVLGLLENMDNVIDRAKEVLQRFQVEHPDIPEEFHPGFLVVTDASVQAAENVVAAARSFFREVSLVRDYINKVDFYESEADRAGRRLKTHIFSSGLQLYEKMHLRYFADQLESISDIAHEVGERLAIAAIKRTM